MAKKDKYGNSLGLLDEDFKSLTDKEKKSRIKDIKIPTVKDTNITGDKAIEYGFAGGKTLGKNNFGAIKTKAQEQNKTQKNGEDIYKDSDGKVVSKFDSKIDTTNKYKGRKANKLNRIEKRVARKQGQKEERKNYRATKLAKRRGMSPEQAKDFMQNRRTRLNQALGEFGKGIMGREQNLSNIDDRMYRKKGTGTLQNMKSKDGGTYDATAPYKGTAAKGYADRGMERKEKDGYTKIMGPKVNIKPADPIKLSAYRNADLKKKEDKQKIQDNITRAVTPEKDSSNIMLDKFKNNTNRNVKNQIVRDALIRRGASNFYSTDATGNQAPGSVKQQELTIKLNDLTNKVNYNPNDILQTQNEIRTNQLDRGDNFRDNLSRIKDRRGK